MKMKKTMMMMMMILVILLIIIIIMAIDDVSVGALVSQIYIYRASYIQINSYK